MKTTRLIMTTAAVALMVTASHAAIISVTPSSSSFDLSDIGATDTLQIIVDTNISGLTFNLGSLGFRADSSNPGVIQITGATVFNPAQFGSFFRWDSATVQNVQDDSIDELLGIDVTTLGLSDDAPFNGNADGGGPDLYLFAEINYTVIGEGTTNISFSPINTRAGKFIVDEGDDVTDQVTFGEAQISVIPEPGTLILAGMGLIGVFAGRRRS